MMSEKSGLFLPWSSAIIIGLAVLAGYGGVGAYLGGEIRGLRTDIADVRRDAAVANERVTRLVQDMREAESAISSLRMDMWEVRRSIPN